jgi:hypothetical protein
MIATRIRLMHGLLSSIAAAIAFGVWASSYAQPAVGGQPAATADANRILNGSIDIHLHIDPRTYGAEISTLKLAKSRGVRGVVIKNHYEPTLDVSLLLRREIPGIEIFGGIDLNHIVGGVNVAIVEHMAEALGGSAGFRPREPRAPRTGVVWMPTFDSETAVRAAKQTRPFLTVSRGGELVPEVKKVISVIAKGGLVLATGHNSPEEVLMLLREGRAQGVQHMVVTHAMDNPVFMKIPQMQEAVKLGALVEFDYRRALTEEGQVDAIRAVGPQHIILSEFLMPTGGADPLQYGNLDNLPKFMQGMRGHGFTNRDFDLMFKENPARLLGLPVGTAH